jgi:IMP dehydrogenase/GMP reductase
MLLDFDDLLIKPAVRTRINSRSQIDILDEQDMLPLFTAPMDTVVGDENTDKFINNGIRVILPRKADNNMDYISTNSACWFSYGLVEFNNIFLENTPDNRGATMYALIDIANGHMPALLDAVNEAKNKYNYELVLMVGNVANPETYGDFSIAGADYVRIGIGNGGGCLTTVQTGVGFPMASLIKETYDISRGLVTPAKIVADGGFKKYSDVIKALALGADYVMLGSIFNKALESAGTTTNDGGEIIDQYSDIARNYLDLDIPLYKTFRGMSTKEVQKDWGKTDVKTSEGVVRKQRVEYTLAGWVENFSHYLKSAMSYTDSLTINEFIGKPECIEISQNSFNRYNK